MKALSLLSAMVLAACTEDVAPHLDVEPPVVPIDSFAPGDDAKPDDRCISLESGAAHFGTVGHDEPRDIAVTATGSIVIAGYSNGELDLAGDVVESRAHVLEYAHDLASSRERASFDEDGADSFASVAIAPDDGTVWLVARSRGHVAGFPLYGDYDVVVGELVSTGFRPLARGFDLTAEYPQRLAVGPMGHIAVAGYEHRLMADETTWTHPFLATFRRTPTGLAPQWLTTRRTEATETYVSVDVLGDAVVVGGHIAKGARQGMFVTVRDRHAGLVWERHVSVQGSDSIAAVRMLPDGDVLWAGTSSADLVIGRLDAARGDAELVAHYVTEGIEHIADMTVDANGRIYVTGDVAGEDRDAFVLVLDVDGRELMSERWTSNGDDVPTAIALDACGAIAITGHTDGDLGGPSRGARDGFLLVTRVAE